MYELRQKKKRPPFLYSPVAIGLLVIVVLAMGRATWNVYGKQSESAEKRRQAETELTALKERQKVLTAELERLKTQEGIEAEIRENYGLAKQGEGLAIIITDENQRAQVSKTGGSKATKGNGESGSLASTTKAITDGVRNFVKKGIGR